MPICRTTTGPDPDHLRRRPAGAGHHRLDERTPRRCRPVRATTRVVIGGRWRWRSPMPSPPRRRRGWPEQSVGGIRRRRRRGRPGVGAVRATGLGAVSAVPDPVRQIDVVRVSPGRPARRTGPRSRSVRCLPPAQFSPAGPAGEPVVHRPCRIGVGNRRVHGRTTDRCAADCGPRTAGRAGPGPPGSAGRCGRRVHGRGIPGPTDAARATAESTVAPDHQGWSASQRSGRRSRGRCRGPQHDDGVLASPLSWMSATSATTDNAPAAGSGAESRTSQSRAAACPS